MKKHLLVALAIATFAGIGLYAVADDPMRNNKSSSLDSNAAVDSPPGSNREGTSQADGVPGNPAASSEDGDFNIPGRSDTDTSAEFNEPSRDPAEMYSQIDPAFSKYVDLSLLAPAIAGPDVTVLADVALGLAEGERVLVRNHRIGLTSDALVARVAKLAARTDDKAALDRLTKASTTLNKPQWAKVVAEAKEFAGVSRDGPMVALEKIDVTTVALMQRVRQECGVAELTGQKELLDGLKKEVESSKIEAKLKTYLTDLIDSAIKGVPEKSDATDELLREFDASSRGFPSIPRPNIPSIPRPNIPNPFEEGRRQAEEIARRAREERDHIARQAQEQAARIDQLRREAQHVIDEFHRLQRDAQTFQRNMEEAKRLASMDGNQLQREGVRRLTQMGTMGSNREQFLAQLRGGTTIFVPSREFDHFEQIQLAQAVGASVATANPGPVYMYLQQFILQSKQQFMRNLQNVPGQAQAQLLREFESLMLRSLNEALNGRRPQPITVQGVTTQVDVATFNHWVNIRYSEPQLRPTQDVLGVRLYRIEMVDRQVQVPLPNTFMPYVRMEVRFNREFMHGSRSSRRDAEDMIEKEASVGLFYSEMDPAFSKFVDLSLLSPAMDAPNASMLTDVIVGLAEGERVLMRNHYAGLTSDGLVARVARLAARTDDQATLDRLTKASTSLNKPQWVKMVAEAKEFAGVSRDGPMVALGKIDVNTVALLKQVRDACDVAELTSQKGSLDELKKEVASSELNHQTKSHVVNLIDSTLKGLPEKSDDTGILLDEFSAASRQHWIARPQDWGKKGVILFPSRPSESTSSLAVMSYATIRNPTSSELIYFVDGRRATLQSGYKTTYTLGTNSGNYQPASIRFENGRGVYREYSIGDGRYRFQWTSNGLDLFRD